MVKFLLIGFLSDLVARKTSRSNHGLNFMLLFVNIIE